MDGRQILTLLVYAPFSSANLEVNESVEKVQRGWFRIRQQLNFSWVVRKEWCAEAGNMAVAGEFPNF